MNGILTVVIDRAHLVTRLRAERPSYSVLTNKFVPRNSPFKVSCLNGNFADCTIFQADLDFRMTCFLLLIGNLIPSWPRCTPIRRNNFPSNLLEAETEPSVHRFPRST